MPLEEFSKPPLLKIPSTTYEPSWTPTPFGRLSRGLFWEADRRWRKQHRLSVIWTQLHYIFGVLGTVLAAIAGFGGLAELLGKTEAGWIALGSAAASSLALFLKSEDKSKEHGDLAAAWDDLRDDITMAYESRPPAEETDGDPVDWQRVVNVLQARARDLRDSNLAGHKPVPSWNLRSN
jgi:hypothetical protein